MRFKLKRPIKIWRFWRLHVFGKHEVIKCGNNCPNLGLLLHTRPSMIRHFIWFSLQYNMMQLYVSILNSFNRVSLVLYMLQGLVLNRSYKSK